MNNSSSNQVKKLDEKEYIALSNLDLYDSPKCESLATQAACHRHLKIIAIDDALKVMEVRLLEDGYQAWLPQQSLDKLQITSDYYQPTLYSRQSIEQIIPHAIAFAQAAMARPNYYLWGGTVAPNYDCSGLVQAAMSNFGVWLPRNSYQQAAFTTRIAENDLEPGDLVFFAKKHQVDHVGLYLGDRYYIHSSGKDMGRNGIGIDRLGNEGDTIGKAYYQYFWGCGRIMQSFIP
ncbi:MAG: NlpC/P60 family protein [Cyanobacteria bacterium J083]|nr:MAG: NlpC/P60 family protein [Cyanobacteria bacterium J083]